jgi:hypothetical protein
MLKFDLFNIVFEKNQFPFFGINICTVFDRKENPGSLLAFWCFKSDGKWYWEWDLFCTHWLVYDWLRRLFW